MVWTLANKKLVEILLLLSKHIQSLAYTHTCEVLQDTA